MIRVNLIKEIRLIIFRRKRVCYKMIKIKKNNIRLFIALTLFILSGHLYLLYGQTIERILLVVSVPFFLRELVITSHITRITKMNALYIIFISCFFIDACIYLTWKPVVYAFGMIYVWYISFKVIPYVADRIKIYKWFIRLNLLISYIILIMSVFLPNLSFKNYAGVFGNPNSLGNYAVITTGMLLPSLLDKLITEKKNHNNVYLETFFIIVCLFCIIISSCRTAFITFLFQMLFAFIFIIKHIICDGISDYRFKMNLILLLSAIALFILCFVYTDFFVILENSIFNKFEHYSNNIFNNRAYMWTEIMNNSRMFEDGNKLFPASHNVYFGLIDQFGYIASLLFLLFVCCNIYKAFVVAIKSTAVCCYVALFTFYVGITFLCISMTENMLLTNSMLIMFVMMPTVNRKCFSYVDN